MMKRALEGVDARASSRAPGRDVAPELEAICVRACALDPAQRPRSARELADAIDAYLSGDRDLELRRTLATVHLEHAREAMARAQVPNAPLTERTDALREIGRAVALDPQNAAALALLVATLTDVPKEPPVDVLDAVEAARAKAQWQILPRVAFFYFIGAVIFLPFQVMLGVRDRWLVGLPVLAYGLASAAIYLAHRANRIAPRSTLAPRYLSVLSAVAIATSSVYFGPLLLLPTLVLMSTMGTLLVTTPARRTLLLVVNGLALLVPLIMAWAGVHPVGHAISEDRTLSISISAFAISRNGLFALCAVSSVTLFVVGAWFASRYRDALTAAQTTNELHAWQLRQLVPAEAARALGPSSANAPP